MPIALGVSGNLTKHFDIAEKMEITEKENQETQNTSTNKLDLFNPLKSKTTDEIIKLITLGLLISFLMEIFTYWDLTINQFQNLLNQKTDILNHTSFLSYIFVIILYLITLVVFLKKKRIGWILISIVYISLAGISLVLLSLAIYWIITTAIFGNFSLFIKFNFKDFFSTIGEFAIPLIFVISINKKTVSEAFGTTKLLKFITIGISIVFIILWSLYVLPHKFRDKNGLRKYLPKEFYNRYDFPISFNDYIPLKTKNTEVEKLFQKAIEARSKYDFSGALRYFEEALKLEPNNTDIMLAMSDSYAHDNDLETAVSYIDKAVSIDSTNSGFYNDRGLLYYKMSDNDKALNDYKKALRIDSLNPKIYLNLTLVYYYKHMQEKSFQSIIKAEKVGADKTTLNKYKELIGFYE
jgi:hypothetical protein